MHLSTEAVELIAHVNFSLLVYISF
jgi:hypothetical protein